MVGEIASHALLGDAPSHWAESLQFFIRWNLTDSGDIDEKSNLLLIAVNPIQVL